MLAAILFCGVAAMFTSCTNEDNPADPTTNLSEKIIGMWLQADINGNPALTNEKSVTTFVSATKAYFSISRSDFSKTEIRWNSHQEYDVKIDGNKIVLTTKMDEHVTLLDVYTVSSITNTELIGKRKHVTTRDGVEIVNTEYATRLVKVTADYAQPILGLWECEGLIGDETYNDGNDRLEFLADGTYRFYHKDDAGQWQTVTKREFQDYFVDGTLLATRWKNQGEDELREWWEIESLSGDEMVWTALRQNADGSTFQQKMTWKKIDLNVAEKIIGKWIFVERNGEPTPSNKKRVYNFVSPTKAYISASDGIGPVVSLNWLDKTEADVTFFGNKVTLTVQNDEHTTMVDEYTVTAINDTEIIANLKVTSKVDGNVVFSQDGTMRFEKVTTDYKADIVGTWQGHCTSEGSVFDDGQEHRWQYNADGTYVYYVKDGDNWVPYEGNTLNEYFVDGNLLCTRWIDLGQENREWWEITINGDKMNWTALRENEDRTTFTATFEMKKVE